MSIKKPSKNELLKIIIQAARSYDTYLNNKNILVFFSNKAHIEDIEITFKPEHFLHLTGVAANVKAKVFLKKCLESKLSPRDFELKTDGTTLQKAQVLLAAMQLPFTAKMLGTFANSGINLYSEKAIGNIRYTVGLIDRNGYIPNTLLNADIRSSVKPSYKIQAIFIKNIGDTLYHQYSICQEVNSSRDYCSTHQLLDAESTWLQLTREISRLSHK